MLSRLYIAILRMPFCWCIFLAVASENSEFFGWMLGYRSKHPSHPPVAASELLLFEKLATLRCHAMMQFSGESRQAPGPRPSSAHVKPGSALIRPFAFHWWRCPTVL